MTGLSTAVRSGVTAVCLAAAIAVPVRAQEDAAPIPQTPAFGEPTEFEARPESSPIGDREIWSIAFSPDGTRIFSGRGRWDQPGAVRLWDLPGRTILATQHEPRGIASLAVSPDAKYVATVGWGQVVKIRDAGTLRTLLEIPLDNSAARVAWSPDGKYLATCTEGYDTTNDDSGGKVVQLWDAATGKELKTFVGDTFHFHCLAFSPDAAQLAVGGGRWYDGPMGQVNVFNVATGWLTGTLTGHAGPVLSVAFSADGRMIATGSNDNTARLWDVASAQEIVTLRGHENWVEAVAFSPDGRMLVTGSQDQTVKLWDVPAGLLRGNLTDHTAG
ncbi:MAG: WD40 repeat domain-containing protein, partial [Planctomycetaceae bacterium]